MTPERWQQIKEILDRATEIDESAREEFLSSICNGDAELRDEVDSFLFFDEKADEALENPSFSIAAQQDEMVTAVSYQGRQIGNYRIIGELGSGGMGAVFLAERADGNFEQKVALKLIKRGMDSEIVLRRFFNERRILASLEHPNIARLIDGGTTEDGVPYFVMEYVEGKLIIEYADVNELNLEKRLKLFLEVCSAVSFAHQNLVIHRDLKPSNILVTADGTPKLLDFGIAKMLEGGTGKMVTATRQFALTPEYASPEQIRGETLTTATDVYSLGIILYEILTGTRPYETENQSFGDIINTICETIPLRPSLNKNQANRVSAKSLQGDLDNIILKALRKEPERRYASVEQLSTDIDRHLNGLPVSATRDTTRYRLGKFFARNRYVVAAAALIFLTMAIGLVATLYQARIAQREKARAEQRFNDVRRLTNSIMFEMNDKIIESPIRARELLVTRALEYLDKLAQETDSSDEIQSELATAYEKIGEVQAQLFDPGLGRTSEALASHRRALEIRETLYAKDPNNTALGLEVVRSHLFVGDLSTVNGEIAAAVGEYEKAIDLNSKLAALKPDNDDIRLTSARAYARMGQAVLRSGSLGLAERYYDQALEIYQETSDRNPENARAKRGLLVMYSYIGYVKLLMLDLKAAHDFFSRSLETTEKLAAADTANAQYRDDLSNGRFWLGIVLNEEGRYDESLAEYELALELQRSLSEADQANLGIVNGMGDTYVEIGITQTHRKNFPAALAGFRSALGGYSSVLKADTNNQAAKRQVAYTQRNMADTITISGDLKGGYELYQEARSAYKSLIENDDANTEWQNDLATCELKMAENLLRQNRRDEARILLKSSIEMFEKLAAGSSENMRIKRDLEMAKYYIAG
jgi:non-specific serine/threonine protein kinase/serine/threonine-protein kinase